MKLFDPHIHMTSRTTDDYQAMTRHVTTGHPASNFRIDTLDGAARIHIDNDGAMFDDKDHALELVDGTWFADPCTRGQAGCTAKPVPVPAARAKAIAATLEANHRVREPLPAFMVPYLKDMGFNGSFRGDSFDRKDLTSMLGASIGWFIEFPHVDGAFVEVFATLPGYRAGKRMHGDTSPRGEDEYEYKHDVMADKDPVDADADE